MVCKVLIYYSIVMIKNASSRLHPISTAKYFVLRDFANMFCSVPFSTIKICLHLQRDTLYLYLATHGVREHP